MRGDGAAVERGYRPLRAVACLLVALYVIGLHLGGLPGMVNRAVRLVWAHGLDGAAVRLRRMGP